VNLDVASLLDLKMPALWSEGEGRRTRVLTTESTRVIFRGSRDGMLRKIFDPVLETRCGGAREAPTGAYKATKSRRAVTGVGGVHSTV